jgi:hypothetical protein
MPTPPRQQRDSTYFRSWRVTMAGGDPFGPRPLPAQAQKRTIYVLENRIV